jgi:hypothetical protein
VRDPLEDWIREVAALTDTFSLQQPGVDRTCLGLEVVVAIDGAQWQRERERASQRWTNTVMVPGPSRSQICCNAAGSSQKANRLDNSANPMPAWIACRFAHSWPFTQTLIGHGQYVATLMNAGPKCRCRHFGPYAERPVMRCLLWSCWWNALWEVGLGIFDRVLPAWVRGC